MNVENNKEIRLAREDDFEELISLLEESSIESKKDLQVNLKGQIQNNTSESSSSRFFIGLINNEIVSYAKIFYYSKDKMKVDFKSPDGWYTNGVFVKEEHRRKGFASSLLKARAKYAKDSSIDGILFSIVATDNNSSIKYHQNLNFNEHSRATGFLNVQLRCGEGILFYKD